MEAGSTDVPGAIDVADVVTGTPLFDAMPPDPVVDPLGPVSAGSPPAAVPLPTPAEPLPAEAIGTPSLHGTHPIVAVLAGPAAFLNDSSGRYS